MICMDFLFNEDSRFCCLPEEFTTYHSVLFDTNQANNPQTGLPGQPGQQNSSANASLPSSTDSKKTTESNPSTTESKELNSQTVTEEEIQKAKEILAKAKEQNSQNSQYQSFYKN